MGRAFPALWLALLLAPMLLLTGCMRENNHFVYHLESAPQNLDPQSAADEASRQVVANLFEGLVTVGADGTIQPGAAEDWTQSEDGLTYTFHLRRDGAWSNGEPVTAADFLYGFQRLFDPATNAPGAADFFCIRNSDDVYYRLSSVRTLGVTAEDDYTLVIQLERYHARFLELLSTAPAMPCNEEFFLETKGKYGLSADKIMGNGPFTVSSWLDGGTVRLRPNSAYHSREAVRATSVTLSVSSEEPLDRFQAGDISGVLLTGGELLTLGELSEQEVLRSDSTVWGLVFRTDAEPFSQPEIRKALFLNADFSTVEAALPDYYQRAKAVVSKNVTLEGENYRDIAGELRMPALNRGRAREAYRVGAELLSEGSLSGVRLILPAGYGHEEYFAYLSQIWQRDLGLYLTVEVLDGDTYARRLAARDYECALIGLSGSYNSPAAVLSRFGSEGGLWQNKEFDQLLDEAAGVSEVRRAAALYRRAEQMLIDEYLFLPFYYQAEFFVLASGISGVTYRFDIRMPDFRFGVIE